MATSNMKDRPELDKSLDSNMFRAYYWLKDELVRFCKMNSLPASGSKAEISDRIACYLDTGVIVPVEAKRKSGSKILRITEETEIESSLVCSEVHRAFFKEHIGPAFTFNVSFQKWLKVNAGKTYKDAIDAYFQIIADRKKCKSEIDVQFEYNIYIRDFFADNNGRSLADAIKCWNYKKQLPGHHRYERTDLEAIF